MFPWVCTVRFAAAAIVYTSLIHSCVQLALVNSMTSEDGENFSQHCLSITTQSYDTVLRYY